MQGASGLETLLTEHEAARVLQVSLVTVRRWRRLGTGPIFRKLGRSVRYRPADIADFVAGTGRMTTRGAQRTQTAQALLRQSGKSA
jgi:predicted site-specific integrase-resolvase